MSRSALTSNAPKRDVSMIITTLQSSIHLPAFRAAIELTTAFHDARTRSILHRALASPRQAACFCFLSVELNAPAGCDSTFVHHRIPLPYGRGTDGSIAYCRKSINDRLIIVALECRLACSVVVAFCNRVTAWA